MEDRSPATKEALSALLMLQDVALLPKHVPLLVWTSEPPTLPDQIVSPLCKTLGWSKDGVAHVHCGFQFTTHNGFLNATLQVLYHVPVFLRWVDSNKEHYDQCTQQDCVTCALGIVRKHMQESAVVNPSSFLQTLQLESGPWKLSHVTNCDLHYFMLQLLLNLHKDFMVHFRVNASHWISSPIFRCFGGCLCVDGLCYVCGRSSKSYKPFLFIEVGLDINSESIQQSIDHHLSLGGFGMDVIQCNDCNVSLHVKKLKMHMYPRVILLKLQRFDSAGRKKLHPIKIDYSLKVFNQVEYNLCAGILHEGDSLNSGYYEALLRCPDGSFKICRDIQFKKTAASLLSDAVQRNSYIVAYEYTSVCGSLKSLVSKKVITRQVEDIVLDEVETSEVPTNITGQVTVTASPIKTMHLWKVTTNKKDSNNDNNVVHQFSKSGILKSKSGDKKGTGCFSEIGGVPDTQECRASTKRKREGQKEGTITATVIPKMLKANPPSAFDMCFQFPPQKFRFFCGILPDHFNALFNLLGGDNVIGRLKSTYDQSTPKKQSHTSRATPKQKLLITLIRLRRGIPLIDLGQLFNIDKSTVSRIFYTLIRHMYLTFRSLDDDMFLKASEQQKKKPKVFRPFKNLRVILDGASFAIQRPSNFHQQGNTYSSYYSTNVVLFIVGISCYGSIIFVSPGYEGSISDKDAVIKSGLLERLDKGDMVMTDRGFELTSELQKIGVELIKPPLLGNRKKFTVEEEILKTSISSGRIYVEHAIRRIKEFRLLRGQIPHSLVPIVPDMVLVAAYLSNFRESSMNRKK